MDNTKIDVGEEYAGYPTRLAQGKYAQCTISIPDSQSSYTALLDYMRLKSTQMGLPDKVGLPTIILQCLLQYMKDNPASEMINENGTLVSHKESMTVYDEADGERIDRDVAIWAAKHRRNNLGQNGKSD